MADQSDFTAEQAIAALNLQPHPEGGHYAETYRHAPADGGRGAMTAIYYLLRAGEVSAWHRVNDADEIW
ncbi:MAG: cupin, partial [Rhodospirillaceae bacterium]|nr:cupin [Rhodospirillaceae bacterium]